MKKNLVLKFKNIAVIVSIEVTHVPSDNLIQNYKKVSLKRMPPGCFPNLFAMLFFNE